MFEWFYNTTEPEPEPKPEPPKWSFGQIMFYIFICWWFLRVLEKHGYISLKNIYKKNKRRRRKKPVDHAGHFFRRISRNNRIKDHEACNAPPRKVRDFFAKLRRGNEHS